MPAQRILIGVGIAAGVIALGWFVPVGAWLVAAAERARGAGTAGVVLFVSVYVIAAIVLIPGSVLTLAAGFAYGPARGLLVALVANLIVAAVTFALGRSLLRRSAQRTLMNTPKARALVGAIGLHGFKLIVLLRLSPLFPFNSLNYALSLTRVSFGRYLGASLLGMLPGTWLYVYLGSLATAASHLASGGERVGPQRLALLAAGLAATAIAVTIVARAARRMIDEELRSG